MKRPKFCVGTIKNPTNDCSHAWRGKWSVNCINMWVATLGPKLNLENAILEHQVIVIHEITHALSGIKDCCPNNDPYAWDRTIKKLLKENLQEKN